MSLPFEYTFLGGALLGLASSLHCAGMCGPLASSLLFTATPAGTVGTRLKFIALTQTGKAFSYAMAGLAMGSLGSGFLQFFDRQIAFQVAQWAAAAAMLWVGLSVAGIVPSLAAAGSPVQRLVGRLGGPCARAQNAHPESALLAGMLWGLMPCGMVYTALASSMLTGNPIDGASMMLGFASGTVPSVTSAALGMTTLKRLARSQTSRVAIGFTIAAFGVLGALLTAPGGPFCYTP